MKDNKEILNILIVSLDENFGKKVSSVLASKLDMFVADCKDLVVYDLINPKDVLDKCGIEYFKKREKGVLRNCAEYHNTVLSININLFKEYYSVFNNSLIIYLKLDEKKITTTINKISYENYNDFLEKNVDIVVPVINKSKEKATEKLMYKLGEIL